MTANAGTIAQWIALALEGPIEHYDYVVHPPAKRLRSTIYVIQAKAKFGYVRVYCNLANLETVTALGLDAAQCLLVDAVHYRQTYLAFANAFPELAKHILDGADYPELLCKTRAEFIERIANDPGRMWNTEELLNALGVV